MVKILGIDPGSRITGYGVVEFSSGNITHIEHGIISLVSGDMGRRLRDLADGLEKVIERTGPVEMAIERVFVGANAQSALKLGQARGVAILTAARSDMLISEYSPNQIKKAVVGRGHANKNQMKFMVRALLSLSESLTSDSADALAVAICHCNTSSQKTKIAGALKK